MTPITLQLLGGASMRVGTTLVSGPPAQRHRIALLTLLLCAGPQPLSRDRAMALLWPERPLRSARRLLNLAVHVLRTAFGEGAITSTVDGLVLDPAHLQSDLHDLCQAVTEKRAADVVRLYTGPLLDGFHLAESVEFGHWLDERRAAITDAFVSALLTVAEAQEKEGDHRGLVTTYRRLVAADPHSVPFAQRLMRALAAAGESDAVHQHARYHAERRRADLGLPPDPAVEAVANGLRGRAYPTIAVFPFRNLGLVAGDQCFADGLTEDVIARLSRLRGIRVISRASAVPCKDGEPQCAAIGDALGVTARLDGSVRRTGDKVRIVAQLSGLEPERLLRGETYDREVGDHLALQSEVAEQVTEMLAQELGVAARVA